MKKPIVIGFAAKKSSGKSTTIWHLSEFFDNCVLIDADWTKSDLSAFGELRKKITKLDNTPVVIEKAANAAHIKQIVKRHEDKDYIFVDTAGNFENIARMREIYDLCDMLILPVSVGVNSLSFGEVLKFVHGKHNYRVLITNEGRAQAKRREQLRESLERNPKIKVLKRSYPTASLIEDAAMQGTRLGEGFGIRRGLQELAYKRLADEIKAELKKDFENE